MGDELLVAHVALRIGRDGALLEGRIVRPSDRPAFDVMSLAAVKDSAPFSAPPSPLLDGAGGLGLDIELACDCARRSPRP